MIKIKKTLLGTLLSCLMVVCLCFGIVHIKSDTKNVSAEAIQTTETTAITNMQIRDSFLLFFTDTNDYASAGANTSVNVKGMTDYNTLDKVKIYTTSGEVVPLWKVVSGMDCYKRYGENNSVAYKLNGTYDGTTIAGVYIPEGTEFPSYEYTNNSGTAKAYVTDKAYTLMSNSTSSATLVTSWTLSSRGTITEEETSVTKVHLRGTNKLLFFLSASDYANTGATTTISGTKAFTDYNTLDKIVVYTTSGEYSFREAVNTVGERYYNIWGETGSVSYSFKSGFDNTNVTKLFIPAGTEFPSYAYTNNGGEHKAYVTTKNLVYVNNAVGGDSTNWSATTFGGESSMTTTETTAITNMHIRDSFLLFFTNTNDYASAGANTSVNVKGMTDYNTLDKVKIYTTSGEVVPLWKVVSGMDCYKRYGENNSVAYKLNGTYDGTTIAGVYIPEGTEFPSYEYTNNGGTAKAYVTDKAYTLMSNSTSSATLVTSWTLSSRGTITEEETSVTKVHLRGTNKLLFFLSASDYADTGATTTISGTKAFTDYNTLDKIVVYTTSGEYSFREAVNTVGERYYNIWGETGSVSYSFKSGFDNTNVTKLFIPAGTEFPSYAYTNNGGEHKAYVTTKNLVYVNNAVGGDSTNWSATTFGAAQEVKGEEPLPENPVITIDTAVTSLGYNNGRLAIILSESDYASAPANTPLEKTAFADFNTLTNITVNGTTFADLWTGDVAFINMWEQPKLWIPMATPVEGDEVVIPAGTQFPSYSAVSGGTLNVYVTTADVTYVYAGGAWQEKVVFDETVVTAEVNRYADKRLMLTITGGDYSGAPATKSYDASKLGQLNTLDYILINGTPLRTLLSEAQTKEYYVNLYTETGLAFGQLTIKSGDIVTIKNGTQFPSWAYINAGTATCYVTQKEVSYKCFSTGLTHEDWAEVFVYNEIATGIARVDFNDTGSDNILHVYLTESDYGTSEGGVDFSGKIASLNMGEYIEIDGVKLSAMTLGSQLINFWTRWGAFGLQLTDYTTKAPSYIYVKAGCQLPSLSYAKGETYDIYVVEEDTWIVYNEYNDTWEILAQAPETTVAIGDILPAYESVAGRIFLGWEINGALYQGGKAATVAGVAKAIWVDYALKEGASIRMGDTANQSGIRFTALLQEESFNTYGAYINSIGVIVLPAELLGTEEFTVEHSAQPVDFYALKEKGFHFADGILSVSGTLHTVRPTNYNRDYAARAYVGVTYADGTTANAYGCFQEENNVRNIYEVASKAYKAGEGTDTQRPVLVGYANKIADVTFDGTTFTATEGTIGTAISSIKTQSIADGVVTLSIVTTQNEEPLLIVNGKPIRSSEILEKSFATNLFTVSFLYETESNLTYYASDDAMQQFFQDYSELYTMSGQYAVTHSPVSHGPTYQQDWYMNAISWFNATNLVVNENSATQNGTYSAEAYALYYLNNIDIDKNGNVYADMKDKSFSTADGGPAYSTVTSYYLMSSQGWALPNMESIGWKAYHAEFNANVTDTTLSKELSSQSGYATAQESSKGWKVNGSAVTQSNGVAGYVGTAKTGLSNVTGATNAIVYEVTDISYSAFNAPFVEVRLLLDDPNAVITDYAIEWQTGGSWYSVKQSEYANNPYEMPNATGMYRSHFPLYTHANYGAGRLVTSNESANNHKTITGLRVVLIAKDTTTSVKAKLDYVRATADSRHSVNGPKYVVALNEYASNHNDIELLVNNITRARRAMLFQLEPLQGKNGLVNLSYLHRHDSYQGAPNSYWDIYPAGCLNTEANVYFYEGLLALADMEEALAKQGITVTETASIEWHDLSGAKQTATYTHTADSLRTLAETVKGNIQTTFYNGTTGRFAWSVRDVDSESGNKEGTLMDYGFTELNLHAVEAGVADTDQAASIMSWINGTRKVSGDKVSGNGIYEQPFAPVTTTADNQKYTIDGSNITSVRESDFSEYYYDKKYGVQCQDGGTIMHVSYYDILARAKVLGVENAYGRISAIANWFVEVQKKNPNAATAGWADFFKNYYTASGDLQGSGTAGKYGLQDEFKEAVMVMATAPKIFLGLDARYDTLTIAPNLGSLTHFGMENLAFGEKTYTCYATASSIALSGIAGNANSGLKVTLKLKYTAGQSVYLNGKLLDSGEYTVEGDYVTVTTDFANLTLQVK